VRRDFRVKVPRIFSIKNRQSTSFTESKKKDDDDDDIFGSDCSRGCVVAENEKTSFTSHNIE